MSAALARKKRREKLIINRISSGSSGSSITGSIMTGIMHIANSKETLQHSNMYSPKETVPPKKRKYYPNIKQDHEFQTSIGNVEQTLTDIRNSTADENQSYNLNNTQIHCIQQIQNSIQNNTQAVYGCTNLLLAAKKITSSHIDDFQISKNHISSNKNDHLLIENTVNESPIVSSPTIVSNCTSSPSIPNESISNAIKIPSVPPITMKVSTKTTTSKNVTKRKRSKKAVSPTEIAKAKEIRMLRNRASAAAHRQRNRDLIETLQKEVELWKTKYDNAIDRQKSLELELQWWIKKHKNDTYQTQTNQRQQHHSNLQDQFNGQTHLQKCTQTKEENVVNNGSKSKRYEISGQKEERIKSNVSTSNLNIKTNELEESHHTSKTEYNDLDNDDKIGQRKQNQQNSYSIVDDSQHTLNNENDKKTNLLDDQVNLAPIKRGPIWKKVIGVWSI